MYDEANASPARIDLSDLVSLRELREEVERTVGTQACDEVLFRIGYVEGLVDALAIVKGLQGEGPPLARFMGPGADILFAPDRSDLSGRFGGVLLRSAESELYLADGPPAAEPVCSVATGYASGWFSGLLAERIVVGERACRACGAADCRYEARRIGDWQDDPDMRAFAARLELDMLESRAQVLAVDEINVHGPMLGQFDPLSPAAHIWGPVMILPYGGFPDSEDALASLHQDLGPSDVQVIVVDLTGARIEALEAAGLARLIDRIESLGGEAVLVGLDTADTAPLIERNGTLAMPVCTRDLAAGIQLAFQLCDGSRLPH